MKRIPIEIRSLLYDLFNAGRQVNQLNTEFVEFISKHKTLKVRFVTNGKDLYKKILNGQGDITETLSKLIDVLEGVDEDETV